MTQAFGDAWFEVHLAMDPFDRDMEREADKIRRDDRGHFKRAGEGVGDTMGDAASTRFASHARDFGRKLEEEVRHRPIRVKQKVDVDYDVDTHRLGAEIHEAVAEAFGPGGPVNTVGKKFGLALGDAFGAGFGVSGRSALIPFIALLVGVIGALILAAVQAVNALIAVLATIPALVAAIGLEVGVVILAFKGLGTAISGAFAAKDAKELKAALKDLTPSAQEFVKTLLPLRDLFKYLEKVSQEAFFKELGPVVSELQIALGNIVGFHLGDVAAAMGRFARSLALVFASPSFQRLLEDVIPATVRWLDKFGPGFAAFLIGWIDLANASLPFLEAIGGMLANGLKDLGEWMSKTSKEKGFKQWLDDMRGTLDSVVGLFESATGFVASFMDALNKNGGQGLIDKLAEAFDVLATFFQDPAGQKAMGDFVTALETMLVIFTGLVVVVFIVIAAIGEVIRWIKTAITAIVDFFISIGDFFAALGRLLSGGYDGVSTVAAKIALVVKETLIIMGQAWDKFREVVVNNIHLIVAAIRSIPNEIVGGLGNPRAILKRAGTLIVQGLIDGIRSMFPDLGKAVSQVIGKITNYLPGSPAKEGPLSGSGYAVTRGRHLVQDLAEGIRMEIPQMRSSTENMVNNIMFGPGAIQVGFSGVVPTPEQARVTGAAAGQGLADQLAARDVRLAIRTL